MAAIAVVVSFYVGASYGLTNGKDDDPGGGTVACSPGADVVRAGNYGNKPNTATKTKTVTRTEPGTTATVMTGVQHHADEDRSRRRPLAG